VLLELCVDCKVIKLTVCVGKSLGGMRVSGFRKHPVSIRMRYLRQIPGLVPNHKRHMILKIYYNAVIRRANRRTFPPCMVILESRNTHRYDDLLFDNMFNIFVYIDLIN